jgi:nucleoside 2-deoxyribosyltransferase
LVDGRFAVAIPPLDRECIVCGTQNVMTASTGNSHQINCRRCGTFTLTDTAFTTLPSELSDNVIRRSKMSHALRRAQTSPSFSEMSILDAALASYWSLKRLPDPVEAARNLVLWLGENHDFAHHYATPDREMLAAQIGLPIDPGGAASAFGWLFSMFEKRGWFRTAQGTANQVQVQLTPEGWEQYAELSQKRAESRNAFMAMKFGDADLDFMVEKYFKPAVASTGFTLKKLSDEQPAGLIDNQIRAALLSSRFIIADLSHANLGAYWEAGYAEGLGRPVIYTCEKAAWDNNKTHFDTSHMVTVIWEKAKPTEAGKLLTSTIRATLRSEARQTDE